MAGRMTVGLLAFEQKYLGNAFASLSASIGVMSSVRLRYRSGRIKWARV